MFWKKQKKKFVCEECGQEHSDWPALTFTSPTYYYFLPEEVKNQCAELSNDFCKVSDEGQTYYFIRVVYNQFVVDSEENLQYGLWTSLSEKSYEDYKANFKNENHITTYFGWLSSDLPGYDNSTHIGLEVRTKPGNERPEIVPDPKIDHPIVHDYYNGITAHEAQRRVDEMYQMSNGGDEM